MPEAAASCQGSPGVGLGGKSQKPAVPTARPPGPSALFLCTRSPQIGQHLGRRLSHWALSWARTRHTCARIPCVTRTWGPPCPRVDTRMGQEEAQKQTHASPTRFTRVRSRGSGCCDPAGAAGAPPARTAGGLGERLQQGPARTVTARGNPGLHLQRAQQRPHSKPGHSPPGPSSQGSPRPGPSTQPAAPLVGAGGRTGDGGPGSSLLQMGGAESSQGGSLPGCNTHSRLHGGFLWTPWSEEASPGTGSGGHPHPHPPVRVGCPEQWVSGCGPSRARR